MKLEIKGNPNYAAIIVAISNLIPLEKCDNIQGTIIEGCHVIVSKDVKVGDVGIFFPAECAIKPVFLNANSLYREKELNVDKTKAGFFELNGRVRCMRLRGFKSDGFFMPLNSLAKFGKFDSLIALEVGTSFDTINGEPICDKYVVATKQIQNPSKKDKKNNRVKRFDKLREEIFRFHIDTPQLARNIEKVNKRDIISITEKLHGTSAIFSYISCNRKLSLRDRIAKRLGAYIGVNEYDYIWASRRVVKNQYLYEDKLTHFYSEDIWKTGADELKPFIQKDMTIYYEIVGFLKDGKQIQKDFDYGCRAGQHEKYIYRISSTNIDGKVFEWSMLQIQDWCKANGLLAVPMHYYGYAEDLFLDITAPDDEEWRKRFLDKLIEEYLEKDCTICKNKVPAEGVCLRIESNDIEVYKLKSFAFRAKETKDLDAGLENIEDNQ